MGLPESGIDSKVKGAITDHDGGILRKDAMKSPIMDCSLGGETAVLRANGVWTSQSSRRTEMVDRIPESDSEVKIPSSSIPYYSHTETDSD